MRYYPKDAVVISQVKNGFFVRFKGTREQQEDNMEEVLVFNDFDDMIKRLKEVFRKPEESKT